MSSINLKIDEERDVIQSYYNGGWNDLYNKDIFSDLYPAMSSLSDPYYELESDANTKYKTPEGLLDVSKLYKPNPYSFFPINPYNGIVVKTMEHYSIILAVPTDILRLIPNVPKEIFNRGVIYKHSGGTLVKRASTGKVRMASIFGEMPGFSPEWIETSSDLVAITLLAREQNIFPYMGTWECEITLIQVRFLPN